jgi:LPXTG-motif cell wall-anchored protein
MLDHSLDSIMAFRQTVRFPRLIGLLVALATAVLVSPATAVAGPYPAQPPSSSVSSGAVPEGGTVTFSGQGFRPFERISIVIKCAGSDSSAAFRPNPAGGFVPAAARPSCGSTLFVTADANGAFSIQVRLTRTGLTTLVATGLASGVTVTAHVEVVPPTDRHDGGGGNPALPTTGQSGTRLMLTVVGGAAAVLLGGLLLRLARRRRDTTG